MSWKRRAKRAILVALALGAAALCCTPAFAQYNLVKNGTFEGGFNPDGACDVIEPDGDQLPSQWTCFENYSGNWTPETSLILARADNGPTALGSWSVAFQRLDQCNLSGDWTTVEQTIDVDVTSCASLALRIDVKLLPMVGQASHNLGGSGHVQGVCDASGWEYPVSVKIDYLDAYNASKCWQFGWYQYSVTQANRTDPGCGSGWDGQDAGPNGAVSMMIPVNQWVANNLSLKTAIANLKRIKKIRVGGSGWSFEGAVDNVQLLCNNACAHAAYPTCSATCPTGQKCLADSTTGLCECQQIACQQTTAPACGGTCPAGQNCISTGSSCVCVPASCSSSPYPQCAGACPTGTSCIADPLGTACHCEILPCESFPYPMCAGPCPTGQICTAGPQSECLCLPVACESSGYPECGGTCPVNEQCVALATGACACEPIPCESSGYPVCDGSCPANYACKASLTSSACYCEQLPCDQTPAPQCGGSCQSPLTCQVTPDGTACACQAPPCGQAPPTQCSAGACPTPLICDLNSTGDACACRQPLCTETSPPACGGMCPVGEECIISATNACQCEPIPCERSAYPQCGGPCPVGQQCVAGASGACECQPLPCEQTPYPTCNGPCPGAQACTPDGVTQACACREPDHTVYKAKWPDYAPSGMPDFEQLHNFLPQPPFPPVNPRTACGPTALVNSFWWFDSEMECDTHHTTGDAIESEPNDTCSTADVLGETPPLKGAVAGLPPPVDQDWFTFVVPKGGVRQCTAIVSTFALAPVGAADTKLSLYSGCAGGAPGTLLAENDDAWGSLQSEVAMTLPPGQYYVLVQTGHTGQGGAYVLTLGLDCDPLIQRWTQWAPDDHSPYNVEQLIASFWTCSNTDDLAGGGRWKGTLVQDLKRCADLWTAAQGLSNDFTRNLVLAPTFDVVQKEVRKSEDVVLLLGFYWQVGAGIWLRCGGHYVTAAGVDPVNRTITVSDPYYNNAEPAPAGNGAPGQVLGPNHANHAPGAPPPPDHDDAINVSHDRYAAGPSALGGGVSNWSLTGYATAGATTTCEDVFTFCGGSSFGQNPLYYPMPQQPCTDLAAPVSVEVEAMVDVSPIQTPVCVYLDPLVAWPANLMATKGACDPAAQTPVAYDLIRGKLCGLRASPFAMQVDLGHVQCLYNDATQDRFDELSPDYEFCFGSWFYLIRQSTDANYGNAQPGGEPEIPSSGGCP